MLGKWPLWRRLSEFATAELWRKSSREKCAAGAFIKVRRFARRLRLARPTAGREAAVCEGPHYAVELVRARRPFWTLCGPLAACFTAM